MRFARLVPLLVVLAGCDLAKLLGGGDMSGGTSGAGTGGGAATGVDCGVDPDTGATLCLGTSLCPGLLVDGEVYPGCGFRPGALDVECSCGGSLCPLGAAATCADVQSLLAQLNEGTVCSQLGGGTCIEGTPVVSTGSGAMGTCDTACRDDCGGDPSCIVSCGC
jgi:hypothetical protein